MHPLSKVVALAGLVVLPIAWTYNGIGVADAQEQTVAKSQRGGLLAKTAKNQFEVFFYPTGVRVFPQDLTGTPVEVSRLTGTVTFYHPNSPKPWFTRPLSVEAVSAGQPQANLVIAIGLSTVPQSGAKATLEIAGLSDSGESTVVTTISVEFVATSNLAPSAEAVATNPRYVYGPGYYGFGYYQYPGPQATPATTMSAPTVYSYSMPGRRSSGGSSSSTHDWTTGRDLPSGGLISKPWLRPSD